MSGDYLSGGAVEGWCDIGQAALVIVVVWPAGYAWNCTSDLRLPEVDRSGRCVAVPRLRRRCWLDCGDRARDGRLVGSLRA